MQFDNFGQKDVVKKWFEEKSFDLISEPALLYSESNLC